MSKAGKIALGTAIAFALLLVLLAIVVPHLIDVDRYRPQVIAHIEEQTGKSAEIGHLALTIFPTVAIRVDDFSLGNPAGFPKGAVLTARRVYAVVDAFALLRRQVVIRSLELDGPNLNLLEDVRGKWNFENPARPRGEKKGPSGDPASFSFGEIARVQVTGMQLNAASLLASGKPGPAFFQGRKVSLHLEQVDLNSFTGSPASFFPPGSGRDAWGSTLAYAATAKPTAAAHGTLKAEALHFGTLEVTSVKSKLRLFPKQVFFDDLTFDLYEGHAAGELFFDFAGRNPRYRTSARLNGVNVANLLEAFAVARGKMTGKMDGNAKLAGEVTHPSDPLAGMQGTGLLNVHNGRLPSLQLNKNLMELARLGNRGASSGDPSAFSSIAADFYIANQRITSKNITILGNGVDVDGAGSLGLAGAGSLDYQGVAKLAAGQGPVSGLLSGLSGATASGGKLTLPFSIGGTLQDPKFILKSAAGAAQAGGLQNMLTGGNSSQQKATLPNQTQNPLGGLTGLFKKKKMTQ